MFVGERQLDEEAGSGAVIRTAENPAVLGRNGIWGAALRDPGMPGAG